MCIIVEIVESLIPQLERVRCRSRKLLEYSVDGMTHSSNEGGMASVLMLRSFRVTELRELRTFVRRIRG